MIPFLSQKDLRAFVNMNSVFHYHLMLVRDLEISTR